MKESQTAPAAKKTTARDMTEGSILRHLVVFALPLLLGNVFQLLYNMVDTIVVGNFVSTEALAAISATTTVTNMMVFFFNGLSMGATVVISQCFGARELKRLHTAVETTVATTFAVGAAFTVLGIAGVPAMLRLMSTPDNVMQDANVYLRICFGGALGLLTYNMGSGILRAVGDTKRPLIFLIVTSVLNIILDLLFVVVFKTGIAGAAIATIISQFVSAALVLVLLTKTQDIYRFSWKDMGIDTPTLKEVLRIGLPAAIQGMLTSISNTVVQGYVNVFGAECMAGWGCYNKLDQFIAVPAGSFANASTTFVGQNYGAGKLKRANKGAWLCIALVTAVTGAIIVVLCIFAAPCVSIFTGDENVVEYGVKFIKLCTPFLIVAGFNHCIAGAMRGRGDSFAPMVIMLVSFVALRQAYLFIVTNYFANTPATVALSYPVGWVSCAIVEIIYYCIRYGKANEDKT